jgi:hypothetical protein
MDLASKGNVLRSSRYDGFLKHIILKQCFVWNAILALVETQNSMETK